MAPGAPAADWMCAVCIHKSLTTPSKAVTMVNGTAVCQVHAARAPRAALPLEDNNG
jgi:hypothetical protein